MVVVEEEEVVLVVGRDFEIDLVVVVVIFETIYKRDGDFQIEME